MRKKRTILWLVIVLLVLTGAGWAWHLYEKPHQSAAGIAAEVTIEADTLYRAYQANEQTADQKFKDKVLAVTGTLAEIQHSGNAEIWILSSQPDGAGVNCQLFAGTKVEPEPKPGDRVRIKGRCTGFLMDVNLSDCVPDR